LKKHFLTVLMENDMNCTKNNVGMFQVQKQVIMAWFASFPALVVFIPESVLKV